MSLPYWINQGWYWLSRAEGQRFRNSTRNVHNTQVRLLKAILQRNRDSEYGRRYRFADVQTVGAYRSQVPIINYDALQDYVGRILRGEKKLLTEGDVERLVPTGGSSGGSKLIPYTAMLKRDFQRAVATWVSSTFQVCPAAMTGPAYWSITPMGKPLVSTNSCVPVGFESDSEYLGGWSRWFAERLLLPPQQVSRLDHIDDARYANLFFLLASPSLALISVWSPTFLLSMLNQLPAWIDRIGRDLCDGQIRFPQSEGSARSAGWKIKRDSSRANQLVEWFSRYGGSADFIQRCWPKLALVSCWGDGNSAPYFKQLEKLFPSVCMQRKGLLATECVVSFPSGEDGRSSLAIRSHFFEFAPIKSDGTVDYSSVHLADELRVGTQYRVIVTTNGGLYRYDLGDVVEVIGFEADCPQLCFVGRMEAISDLVGEKLNETHVRSTLEKVLSDFSAEQELHLVVYQEVPELHYVLLLSADTTLVTDRRQQLATALDERLRSNPQYDLARSVGQLACIDVRILPERGRELWAKFETWQSGLGKRVGDMKVSVLDYRGTWREFLRKLEHA
ncbi:MAG: GH3 auxin-responsive promoter family protein [Planctomycetes bacterium]|nr:GH3 auxin-responsive promoter family protein [Planctomycetota bacterium]